MRLLHDVSARAYNVGSRVRSRELQHAKWPILHATGSPARYSGMVPDSLLTPRDVACRLGISTRTVYAWIEQGRLPSVHLSPRVTRIPEGALTSLIRGATVLATDGEWSQDEIDTRTPSERVWARIGEKREEVQRAVAEYGGSRVRVIGSVARGEAQRDSDLDLLVDVEPQVTLFDLGGMNATVGQLLGVEVDVVAAQDLTGHALERALGEARSL